MKNLLLIFVFITTISCSSQVKHSFSKLSKPEKAWVTFHPFKARKAYRISLEAERVTDSIKKSARIGKDKSGGKLDAFKHSYWMARLTQVIGRRAASSLGEAHEKGNFLTYEERKLEDGLLPDKPATDMDLFNNQVGIRVGHHFKNGTPNLIVQKLIDSLEKGNLRVLKKDSSGNFLDCQNKKIPLDSLKNKWDTKKCLVPSN